VARSESGASRDLCVDYKAWGLTDAELDSIAACTGSRRNLRVSTHVSQLENEGDWACKRESRWASPWRLCLPLQQQHRLQLRHVVIDISPKGANIGKYVLTVAESGQYCALTDDGNGSPFNADSLSILGFTPFFEGREAIGVEYGYIEDGVCFAAAQLSVKRGAMRSVAQLYDSSKAIKFYIKNMGEVPVSLHNLVLYTK
jgi:hypothetical protein